MTTLATAPRSRLFYGWIVVLVSALGGFVVSGAGYAAFGQFIQPLSQAFGWPVGVIGLVSTVRLVTAMVVSPVVGWLSDRVGPRVVLAAGALITGAAYLALYFISDPVVFYAVFTVAMALGFNMLVGTPAQAAVARWFRRQRGMAMAIVSMGSSFGGVFLVPAVQLLLAGGDWRWAFGVIGAGILLVNLPLAVLFLRDDPESLGLHADGDASPPPVAAASEPAHDDRQWSAREIWSAPDFRHLAIGLLFTASLWSLIEFYQFPILTSRGVDGGTAALFISIYSLCAALTKFGWGYLADRVDLRRLLVGALWLNAAGLALLAFADNTALFWLYATVSGATGGGQAALAAPLIAQRFGRRSYGAAAGLLMPLTMIVPAIAVPVAGFAFDATYTYAPVFVAVALLAMLTSTSLLRLPGRRETMVVREPGAASGG
ncbi:MAG: MFS transporter [Chloroflexi bacterium]|nr:MFS transporter [Chloroflexota bacterium]